MLSQTVNIITEMICVRKKDMEDGLVTFRSSTIELNENRSAVIDGCKFIINYDENGIELKLNQICVRFTGRDLVMSSLIYGQAVITGEICGIEFFSV